MIENVTKTNEKYNSKVVERWPLRERVRVRDTGGTLGVG